MSSLNNKTNQSTTIMIDNFDNMSLKESLLRGIYAYGWEKPTKIQQQAIIPLVEGKDIIAQAQSGTGKTGAFGLASLQIVDPRVQKPQILALAPTRELANQTFEVISNLNRYMDLSLCRCVGGVRVQDNIRDLRTAQIVIATPGRAMHMLSAGYFDSTNLQAIILDEADEMLDRGFQEAMYDCFNYMPETVQVCLFSATFPPEIVELSSKFMREDAVRLLIEKESVSLEGIKQFYVNVEREEFKLQTLMDLFEHISVSQTIIFCNSRNRVAWLQDMMTREDFTCSCIHGEMENQERELRVKEFRSGSSRVLISTDVLARGFDAEVQLVINYELPHNNLENYIHRIGRSGRHGKKGVSINFMTDSGRDLGTHRELENYYNMHIGELPIDLEALF